MSSFATAVRALSPGVIVRSADDEDAVRIKRQHDILACNSVLEVVSIIPVDYRSICADHITRLAASAERCAKTRATVASWKHHRSVGTLPPNLPSVAPQVQFTAGYSDPAHPKSAHNTITDSHNETQQPPPN